MTATADGLAVGPLEAVSGPEELAALLVDVVDGGASVGFHRPLDKGVAEAVAAEWLTGHAKGSRHIVVAKADGRCVGAVHLVPAPQENGRGRAEVQKLLVSNGHRRRGIGRRLMQALEAEALKRGRRLLILDTLPESPAARLYESLGWRRVGIVPTYATSPDGVPEATAFFYRILEDDPR